MPIYTPTQDKIIKDSLPTPSYADGYKLQVFTIWYNMGKPEAKILLNHIGEDPSVREKVRLYTLSRWISDEFSLKAAILDAQVSEQLDQNMVQDKVEMLKRHAEIAQKIQAIALEYITEFGIKNAKEAIALLVHGIKIEQESRSLPRFLKELNKTSDEELIEEIRRLTHGSDVIDLESAEQE